MRKHRHFFSTPEEHKYLEQLPDQIKIYRACNSIEDQGISWTLENEYAEWYKERFDRKMVVNKVVNKTEVFAYINRNNEHEILILNYLSK